jgi:hypothetical protein
MTARAPLINERMAHPHGREVLEDISVFGIIEDLESVFIQWKFVFKFYFRARFMATDHIQHNVRARPACTLALADVAWAMQSIATKRFSK